MQLLLIGAFALMACHVTAFAVFNDESEDSMESRAKNPQLRLAEVASRGTQAYKGYKGYKGYKRRESERVKRGCDVSGACVNGGACVDDAAPLLHLGMDYVCECQAGFGGYHCQIGNPCASCPASSVLCTESNIEEDGKMCYDANFNVLH